MPGTPPVRRRLLGTALREYRQSLGFNLDEAARILECDRSKISRIETGERGIRAKELRELLTEYGVPDAEREALLAVAHRGRESGWWLDYRDVLSPAAQDYVIMEIAASEILCYEANQVPDLLQTPDYMRAVAAADARYTTSEQRDHAIEVKLNRQRIVVSGRAPRLEAVVTEGALRQTVGPPRVMREQLGRLAALAGTGFADGLPDSDSPEAGRSRIWLRVLPFAAGAHAAAGCGSMTLLRFAETPEIGVIHLTALSGGISLEGREDVARYTRTFAELRSAALPPSRSAHLIRAIARMYDRPLGAARASPGGGLQLGASAGSASAARAIGVVARIGCASFLLTSSSLAIRSWMSRSCWVSSRTPLLLVMDQSSKVEKGDSTSRHAPLVPS